jgi:Dehydrogenases with different specificities (related to short-chain alcohol dehydrogenases)
MNRNPTGSASARRLEGKRAIVTGASKGIGREICLMFAREGALVGVAGGRNREGAEETLDAIRKAGSDGAVLCADLIEEVAARTLIDDLHDALGGLDILVNNAGGGGFRGPLESLPTEEWDRAFALNARSAFLCSKAAARRMIGRKSGSIVNIAGASAHRCYPGNGGFGPSKAAVVSLTRQSAMEWAKHGIRVNAVSPGPIRDPESNWEEKEPSLSSEVRRLPLRRAGTYGEVACAVCYLASDEASYVTGQTLIIDGGGVNTWYLSHAMEEST